MKKAGNSNPTYRKADGGIMETAARVGHEPARGLPSLFDLARYFLVLGATGFGGPIALANYIRVDLVEKYGWLSDDEYERGLAVATACPGPLAYQLGVYCGYIRHGILGGIVIGLAFAFAPFVIVVGIAYVYVHFAGAEAMRGLFYGVGPVVVALIVKACWNLGAKTLRRDLLGWVFAGLAFVATIVARRELTIIFVVAGVFGIWLFRPAVQTPQPPRKAAPSPGVQANATPLVAGLVPAIFSGASWKLFTFFFKTGLLVFGSGLVVVSFIKTYVVDQYHWLDNRSFVDAVAVGMISPGPVVITATFVGYLVNGVSGAAAATAGMFLPSILFTVLGTPLLIRFGDRPGVKGFIRGIIVAVVGVLAGTIILVGQSVIGDWITLTIGLTAIASLFVAKKMSDHLLIALGALVGLVVYPILHPAWMLK